MDHPVFAAAGTKYDAYRQAAETYTMAILAAATAGVPLLVTLHGPDAAEEIVAHAYDVRVGDGVLNVAAEGVRRSVPLRGEGAPAILPTIVPMDDAHRLARASAVAMAHLRAEAEMITVDDGHGEQMMRPDMVFVASTGIYPASALGADWSEIRSLDANDDGIVVRTGDRELTLRAA
jgi:hypothetical protein